MTFNLFNKNTFGSVKTQMQKVVIHLNKMKKKKGQIA